MADYTSIDQPYDPLMNRTPGGTSPVVTDISTLGNQPIAASSYVDPTVVGASSDNATYNGQQGLQSSTGAIESQPINSNGSMDDVWINTFIRSRNWKPGKQGFSIEGSTGDAEFSNVTVRGTIIGSQIIGSTIEANTILTSPVINGGTITGTTLQTATTGERIEITSSPSNSINFFNGSDLIGSITVSEALGIGSIHFGTPDLPTILTFEYSIGAHQVASIAFGGYQQNGSASFGNSQIIDVSNGGTGAIGLSHSGGGVPYLDLTGQGAYTETQIGANLIPMTATTYSLGSSSLRWNKLWTKDIDTTNAVVVSSDSRDKQDITDLTYGLGDIKKLRPVTYTRGDDVTHLGLIAQETQGIIPEIVHQNDLGRYGIAYEEIVPVLINAVKELSARIDELEKQST